jgi:hypothetical protein
MVRVCYKPLEEGDHPLRAEYTPVQGVSFLQRSPTVYQYRRQRDIHPSRGLPLVSILGHTGVERRTHARRDPLIFDVQPTHQQTVPAIGLFFADFFKEPPRVTLASKKARQVQGILAIPRIPFSGKEVAPPLGKFPLRVFCLPSGRGPT